MAWVESRILLAERSVEDLYRRLLDVFDQLKMIRQQVRAMGQRVPGGAPPGEGGGAYVCLAPSAVHGSWSGSAPSSAGSFSATVYQVQGTVPTSIGTKTVFNWMPSDTVAGKACNLAPDGAGNYVVVSQSCA